VETMGSPGASGNRSALPGPVVSPDRWVTLVNGGTASASEILAGALQDDGAAAPGCWADRTFGKGLIQTLIGLGDGSRAFAVTGGAGYRDAERPGTSRTSASPPIVFLAGAARSHSTPAALMNTLAGGGPSSSFVTLLGSRPWTSRTYHDPCHGAHSLDRSPAGRSPGDGTWSETVPFQRAAAVRQLGPAFLTRSWRRIQPLHPQPLVCLHLLRQAPSPGWAEPPTTRSGQTPRMLMRRTALLQ